MWKGIEDYIFSWDPGKMSSGTLNAQIWQIVPSSDTKAENLEHDFTEVVAKFLEMGWSDGERQTRCLVEEEAESSQSLPACLWSEAQRSEMGLYISSPGLLVRFSRVLCLEGIFDSVADWVSLIRPAQVACVYINNNEQILKSLDDQDWAVMSDEWADFMFGSLGETAIGCPGAGLKQKRKKVRKRMATF